MKKLIKILPAFCLLTACVSPFTAILDADSKFIEQNLPASNANYGSIPKNYQEQIKKYMEQVLKDPDSAKYSDFTRLDKSYAVYKKNNMQVMTHNDVYYGYSICFWVNAKNSYGAYVGKTPYLAFFHNQKVMDIKEVQPLLNAAYLGSKFVACPK
ncbi:hypothetical protein Q7Z55_10290 [Glaesserella parasuis]|uniref:hypothetical protein n=1 Tax=Glaesserella parasuis TaxID=738 RepID=UPI0003AC0174|nr:hypothetical protein [Glaesserella parasuis]ATW46318.1 hypothetical protein A2U21_10490 [Glaesserella parasuis str. Nagasaki]EPZ99708.1 hypothetical protein HPSNAG_1939 [Glaesserella parasuis str. Nagasaki]EYE73197.1 hypothetical protein HPNK_00427 [Glaesserella parasuis str. Nagasaki]MCT8518354.1 hypothetical protein [Glaesserella parasuis]MCT8537344.1 hypothetical protein [Glaesserella parasuis]